MPVRHGRMMVSPFTFYRGAAKIMAADLAETPVAGLNAQLCGDAHLSNFGAFASPERRLLFDLNDFDWTLPGPFEYDVKRMAASFEIAARNNGFSKADTRAATLESVRAYREAMATFAQMDTWTSGTPTWTRTSCGPGRTLVAGTAKQERAKRAEKRTSRGRRPRRPRNARPSRSRRTGKRRGGEDGGEAGGEDPGEGAHPRQPPSAVQALRQADGQYRIVSQPPIVVPARDLAATYGLSPKQVMPVLHEQFRAYPATLQDDRRHLLERFEIVDAARKVVGVGSVGTRAFIVLLQGRDAADPRSCRSKRRRHRFWNRTRATAATASTASGWCRGSG